MICFNVVKTEQLETNTETETQGLKTETETETETKTKFESRDVSRPRLKSRELHFWCKCCIKMV